MWFIIFTSVLTLIFYFKQIKVYKYWQEKGIPYSKPLYFVGNFGSNVIRAKSLEDIVTSSYQEFPNSRYVGIYQFSKPILMIRNPELIKQMTVKDFDSFSDHTSIISPKVDPLFSKNLFFLTAEDGWHDMRTILSPAFTSSKLKTMFTLIEDCSTQFVNYFKKENGKVSVEIKDAFTRFTNDIIGTTAFGVTCDSLADRDNEFYLMGKDASNFSGLRSIKIFAFNMSFNLMKILNVKMLSAQVRTFFRTLIKQTIRIREEQNIVRPDMINLMMQAREKRKVQLQEDNNAQTNKLQLTDDEITAQALFFFIAGFETVSSAMTYVTYELAINPDVQEKLYAEIKETQINNPGKITYEVLYSMKYLDCVVSESLRLHAPLPLLDRVSVKPYTIQPTNSMEKPLHLEKNCSIWIPVSALHHDEQYFPNPMKYDPERFNEENKHKINPLTYLPFGIGPRICIGSRFALLEIKLMLVQLLQEFEILATEKTAIPLKSDKTNFNNLPAEGIWVAFNPRTTK